MKLILLPFVFVSTVFGEYEKVGQVYYWKEEDNNAFLHNKEEEVKNNFMWTNENRLKTIEAFSPIHSSLTSSHWLMSGKEGRSDLRLKIQKNLVLKLFSFPCSRKDTRQVPLPT